SFDDPCLPQVHDARKAGRSCRIGQVPHGGCRGTCQAEKRGEPPARRIGTAEKRNGLSLHRHQAHDSIAAKNDERQRDIIMRRILILALVIPTPALAQAPDGWQHKAPRDEIKPRFTYDAKGGPKQTGSFVITADKIEGQHGWWQKAFSIVGG